jgi:dienelactone hydrolase
VAARLRLFGVGAVALCVAVGAVPGRRHVRAAGLLQSFVSSTPGAYAVEETVEGAARLYRPLGVASPPALVLVHGVHHLGMDEPRLVHFAKTIAGAGIAVLTPQVEELADYRVDAHSVETIGAAALALAARLHVQRVGLMGLSFAGGLSLVTAADPRWSGGIAYVISIGGHGDLARVSRFLVSDEAHEYGSLVLVYGHAEDFFLPDDLAAAREALKLWLWDDKPGARAKAAQCSAPAQEKLERLFTHQLEALRPELLACIERNATALEAVSPSAHLGELKADVLLLHGAGDTVIPPGETEWLAHEAPNVRAALVSKALQHVELEGEPGLADKAALVHFMAQVLDEADATAP